MDAKVFQELDSDALCEIVDMLDEDVKDILVQLESLSHEEVAARLVEKSDAKTLHEVRTTIFRAAMDKVDYCLSQIAGARSKAGYEISPGDSNLIDKAERMFKSITPKDMINRKCMSKLTNDIIELLLFACGNNRFPLTVMRANGAPNGDRGALGTLSSDVVECLQRLTRKIVEETDDGKHEKSASPNAGTSQIDNSAVGDVQPSADDEGDSDEDEDEWEVRSVTELAIEMEERNLCADLVSYTPDKRGSYSPPDLVVEPPLIPANNTTEQTNDYDKCGTSSEDMNVQSREYINEGSLSAEQCDDISTVDSAVGSEGALMSLTSPSKCDHGGAEGQQLQEQTHQVAVDKADVMKAIPSPEKSRVDDESPRDCVPSDANLVDNMYEVAPTNQGEEPQPRGEPPIDSDTAAGNPEIISAPAIRVTVTVGDISTVIDLSEYANMSSRSTRAQASREGRTKERGKQNAECKECDCRLDAMSRRVSELEEDCGE